MSAADFQPRTQFGDVAFPSEITHLKMQFRHHVHEYPHTPGGAAEKLGRGLIRVTVMAQFQATFPRYPNLYPVGMQTLFGYALNGATLDFVHPSQGTFPAFITDWDQQKSAKVRSGEAVEITFLEDQPQSFALAAITSATLSQTIASTAGQLAAELAKVQADLSLSAHDVSLFDGLQTAVNSVLSIKDQAQLYGNLYSAKLQGVLNLASQLDAAAGFQDVRAWPVIDSLRALQAQCVNALNNTQQQKVALLTYNVPSAQPLAQVALTLYGDAGEAGSLLSLNGARIDDPMVVAAGTALRYYPPTPQQRAA